MKLLIIEDDKNILSFLKRGFTESDYSVDSAEDGEEGEYLITINSYDILIIDWMLPKKSGIDIIKSIRAKKIKTPVIMLTAKDSIDDKVFGLQIGADDYLSKPFSFKELEARVEVLYRRLVADGSNLIKFKDIIIDIEKKIVFKDKQKVSLSQKEYDFLLFLIKHKNSFVNKFMIEEELWSDEEFVSSNVVEVTIHNIRKKLGKKLIKNFRGLGYKIEF
jgi:DNA-binding response OmpR family regulator